VVRANSCCNWKWPSRLCLCFLFLTCAFSLPAAEQQPVRYIGAVTTSNSDYKTGFHDGQMRVAIGTQNYQILRANRSHPEWSDGLGWTYNHAPMLAYHNGQFYCQYLTTPVGEHIPPGVTMLTRSKDGKTWTKPQILFPIYFTTNYKAAVIYQFMHQRMGFYVAPNGRFLTMAFYGGPYGGGIGRVVREIYDDNSLGPVYFIRVSTDVKADVKYPLYTESPDKGFVKACDAFLADKVRRMQWWEEDQRAKDANEFYRVPLIKGGPGKAFCFYTRPDGAIVGFFKDRWVTVTKDNGQTWTKPVRCETLKYGGAKIWAQRLDNGQYALVYNPTDSAARHPLSIATSDDGISFDHLVNVHGEVPPKRFWGREKRPGPQYVRGIIEGNGNPPGDDLWVVYSVSKEDIWISRVPVPVTWRVDGPVADDFSTMQTGGLVKNWNIYSPQWCPVEVVEFPSATQKSLMLKDFDPYDYAKAVRVFQIAPRQQLSFKVYVESSAQVLDTEVVSAKGERLLQTRIDTNRNYLVKNGKDDYSKVAQLDAGKWYSVEMNLDSQMRLFSVALDGKPVVNNAEFSEPNGVPERIIFRTGNYRLADNVQKYKSGSESKPGWDEPGADEKVKEAVYYIRDFKADAANQSVLNPADFKHFVDYFNNMEPEGVVNAIPNSQSWSWMQQNVPLFECPDKDFEQIYYYRWWTFRKHIEKTPAGYVLTEFITPVSHAGPYNTISCALGHHIYEGRWLKDKKLLDDYIRFWFRGNNGSPQPHYYKYSSWAADAIYNRYLVNHDKAFVLDLLNDLVADYQRWEEQNLLDDGLFWQYDVRDGMEESISGSRTAKNARPTINSYMYGNAIAIAKLAQTAGDKTLAKEFFEKAARLKHLVQQKLWDSGEQFFKVRLENDGLSDAREELGFIPWYFNLPDSGFEAAWLQVLDPNGFKAPFGLTTAERRCPKFRSHGVGNCEWDGAVWPFATSQTLTAMANLLRNYNQSYVSAKDYFDALLTYAKSQHKNGKPYIGEYLDEKTGAWLKGDNPRSRYYNHSTFCDLVISGLVGLCPADDDTIVVHPLVPPDTWQWFALDNVPYHGKTVAIIWDKTGQKYKRSKGLSVYVDGRLVGRSDSLEKIEAPMK
jgi:hypothetical protein